ncbi:MAG TPA: GNAT family N-acetyltransferase [Anaerolineales bacterium]|nr:GNAT family N-acetyltransferase [Anaerolineales bacterium]
MDLMLTYRPADEASIREFLKWKYDYPYELYNYNPDVFESDLAYHLDPANQIFSMFSNEELVGYCSFGHDARVRGGDYVEPALDIGLMIKPSLTGQGLGSDFVKNIVQYAITEFQASKLRVTILESNLRAQRVWEKNGFHKTSSFHRETDQLPFVILTRDV